MFLALCRGNVDDDAGAGRREGIFVDVEISIEAGVGGEFWLTAGRAEEIEGNVGLWHEQVPFCQWEF